MSDPTQDAAPSLDPGMSAATGAVQSVTLQGYMVFTAKRLVRVTTKPPRLATGERAVRLTLKIPRTAFDPPITLVTITVPPSSIVEPTVTLPEPGHV